MFDQKTFRYIIRQLKSQLMYIGTLIISLYTFIKIEMTIERNIINT